MIIHLDQSRQQQRASGKDRKQLGTRIINHSVICDFKQS